MMYTYVKQAEGAVKDRGSTRSTTGCSVATMGKEPACKSGCFLYNTSFITFLKELVNILEEWYFTLFYYKRLFLTNENHNSSN